MSAPQTDAEYARHPIMDTQTHQDAVLRSFTAKMEERLTCALRELQNIENECLGKERLEELKEHVGTQTIYGRVAKLRDDWEAAVKLNALYDRTRHEHRDFAKNAQDQRDDWMKEAQSLETANAEFRAALERIRNYAVELFEDGVEADIDPDLSTAEVYMLGMSDGMDELKCIAREALRGKEGK